MDKRMTSGEIAKKAGVSQKAVRLYDEKGLLKPSEYSEGNYRLYDKEALLVLEKIIALKQIGFSLEEIRDNLVTGKNMDIAETLHQQLEIMEKKKQEIERSIGCIKGTLARTQGQPDWNDVAEIARMIQQDQGADERHFHALKHTAEQKDWYVTLYESLELKKENHVLDLGCGYGKLWRNNWKDIPEKITVQGIDLHGSWAEDFEKHIAAHKEELAEGTNIAIEWADVEDEETWNKLSQDKPFTYVIAHYLMSFIKDTEALVERAASVLTEGGMFSCNGYLVSEEHLYWKQVCEEMKLNTAFITEKIAGQQKRRDDFKQLLDKYFKTVETISLSNRMRYENSEEVFQRLCQHYPESKKYLVEKETKIRDYFDKIIKEQGEVIMNTDSGFWHCYK